MVISGQHTSSYYFLMCMYVCVHASMYVCMYGLGYFKILRENHFLVLDNLHMYSK